jgi:glycosyltransferase involved in cell wall biosynthesis
MTSKKDILFLALHRPKRSPSQRYRIEQFLPALEANDLSYEYDFLLDEKMDQSFYAAGHFFAKAMIVFKSFVKLIHIAFFKAEKFKTVFVQREAFMLGTAFFEKTIAKKAKLVFDFDDSIWMANVSKANAKLAFLKNPDKTAEIIANSDTVIVGNSFLKEYAAQFSANVHIIPTCIDTNEYSRKHKYEAKSDGSVCIGWSGSQTTIAHFKLLEPVLKQLKEKYKNKLYFKVVGDPDYRNDELNILGLRWTKETEISELEEIDIGVMPLPKDEWSKGKCGLKALVYMSMEIPAVIENHGVNSEIISNGVDGFLCKNEEDWVLRLSILIEDELLRKKIGLQGRKSVLEKYSIKANGQNFLRLIQNEQ